jgi:hypothetical protein
MRVGSVVNGSFKVDITPDVEQTLTEIRFTLPVASDFSALGQLSGSGGIIARPNGVALYADITNNEGIISFDSPIDSPIELYVNFTYQII